MTIYKDNSFRQGCLDEAIIAHFEDSIVIAQNLLPKVNLQRACQIQATATDQVLRHV